MERKNIGILILLGIVVVIVMINTLQNQKSISPENMIYSYEPSTFILNNKDARYVEMRLPAVYEANSTGVYALAKMYVAPGYGNIFIHINNVLYGESTEHSIRKAIKYALKHENVSEDAYDFYVSIDSQANMLTGPSAGAAFAIMALALLQNKSINESVMITGTLLHDGRIGASGKIKEKALAAKESGATLFLVPPGLSKQYDLEQREYCDNWGGKEYCEIEEYANITDLQELTHIKIVEVTTIDEAIKYMLF